MATRRIVAALAWIVLAGVIIGIHWDRKDHVHPIPKPQVFQCVIEGQWRGPVDALTEMDPVEVPGRIFLAVEPSLTFTRLRLFIEGSVVASSSLRNGTICAYRQSLVTGHDLLAKGGIDSCEIGCSWFDTLDRDGGISLRIYSVDMYKTHAWYEALTVVQLRVLDSDGLVAHLDEIVEWLDSRPVPSGGGE